MPAPHLASAALFTDYVRKVRKKNLDKGGTYEFRVRAVEEECL